MFVKYFAKKYALSQINKLLASLLKHKRIQYWKTRVAKIIMFLDNLLTYLEDDNIDEEEVQKIRNEVKELFK